ncbi:MAG TPA: hypothetical protein VKJ45_19385 [Blastocatellia bacterium]|nr:hypothetical protein [Blastocatellia bacterium]
MYEMLQQRIRLVQNDVVRAWTFLHSDSHLNIPVSRLVLVTLALAVIAFPLRRATAGESVEERRARIRSMASDALQSLYKFQPGSQAIVEKAAGYAVFDNTGVHVVMPTTAKRMGLAVDTQSGKETFMKMKSEPGRAGSAVEDCRIVFVFEDRRALNRFLDSGWTGSDWHDTPGGLGSKGGEYEGAFRVDRDMWAYQIVERGLAFQLVLAGTSYYKEDKLNKQ